MDPNHIKFAPARSGGIFHAFTPDGNHAACSSSVRLLRQHAVVARRVPPTKRCCSRSCLRAYELAEQEQVKEQRGTRFAEIETCWAELERRTAQYQTRLDAIAALRARAAPAIALEEAILGWPGYVVAHGASAKLQKRIDEALNASRAAAAERARCDCPARTEGGDHKLSCSSRGRLVLPAKETP